MDQIRYIVQPEGDKFAIYKETIYDSGHLNLVFIDSFHDKMNAERLCEELNKAEQ